MDESMTSSSSLSKSLKESLVKVEKTVNVNPVKDHNYSRKPIDNRININSFSAESIGYDMDVSEQVVKQVTSSKGGLEDNEDVGKGITQVAGTAEIMTTCKSMKGKLKSVVMDIERLENIAVETESAIKDTEHKFKQFRASATELCCGISVFTQVFRRQFLDWCVKTGVQEADKVMFKNDLDCITALTEDKIQAWLKDGFLTHAELDHAQLLFSSVTLIKSSEARDPRVPEEQHASPIADGYAEVGELTEETEVQEGMECVNTEDRGEEDEETPPLTVAQQLNLHDVGAVSLDQDMMYSKDEALASSEGFSVVEVNSETPSCISLIPPTETGGLDNKEYIEPCSESTVLPITLTGGSSSGEAIEEDASSSSKVEEVSQNKKCNHKKHLTNPMKCTCGYLAPNPSTLNRHIWYYETERTFSCKVCAKLFVNDTYLKRHFHLVHNKKKPTQKTDTRKTTCSKTEKTGVRKPAYKASTILARINSKKIRSAGKRKVKLLRITAKKRITCHHCRRRFAHIRDFVKHIARRLHGGETVARHYSHTKKKVPGSMRNGISVVCPPDTPLRRSRRTYTTITTRSSLRAVQLTPGPQNCQCSNNCLKQRRKRRPPPRCTICGDIFGCIIFLEEHMLAKHDVSKTLEKAEMHRTDHGKSFVDPNKGEICPDQQPVSENLTTLIPDKSFNFGTKGGQTQEHKEALDEGSSSIFKCTCKKTFASKKNLLGHVRGYQRGKIFKCPFGDNDFVKYFNLKKHLETVHDIPMAEQNRFSCAKCGASFKSLEERRKHRRTCY